MVGAGTNRTQPSLARGPVVVLVRPQLAVNIGMSARAMANFGLHDLRLVAPREGWPRTGQRREECYNAAAGAGHLLDAARTYASVAEAIGDLHFTFAATARERGQAKPVLTPSAAMTETVPRIAGGERHGVLFGPERTGLDNDEVALADAILTFPVNPSYGSLNLAQAVLLVGYEWFRHTSGDAPPFAIPERSPPALRQSLLVFLDNLEAKLDERGFFRPVSKKPVMQRNLRNIFHRRGLTEQDLRTLWGAVVRLVEGPRVTPQTRRRVKPPKVDG